MVESSPLDIFPQVVSNVGQSQTGNEHDRQGRHRRWSRALHGLENIAAG